MNRREALMKIAMGLGLSVAGTRLLAATFNSGPFVGFAPHDIALLDEIADTIIPPTDVPGAKDAHVGTFMAMMLTDCYEPAEQASIKHGIATLADEYMAKFGGSFVSGKPVERTAFLVQLDRQRPKYFQTLKDLVLLGYFTSETGSTQALRYSEVPGRYDGNVPVEKGERAWANPIF